MKPSVLPYSKVLIVALLSMFCLLSGCATQSGYVPAGEDHARIRIFHGTGVYLYLDGECSKDSSKTIHAAAGGYSYLVPNKRTGMPLTEDMPLSYHEYVIPAGRQVAIVMTSAMAKKRTDTSICCESTRTYYGPARAYFTPRAGHDYDAYMEFNKGSPYVRLRELTMTPSGVAATKTLPSENVQPDSRCFDDED